MRADFWREEPLELEVYRDLVESLHTNLAVIIICSLLQAALCIAFAMRSADVILIELAFLVVATIVARLAVILVCRARLLVSADRPTLQAWEGRHAIACIAGAVALGASGLEVALHEDDMAVFMFAVAAASFAMELVARISGRPWICFYALAVTGLPALTVLLCEASAPRFFEGVILAGFLAATLMIVLSNYRALTARITAARSFADLANADALTGLPNRLALRDFLDRSLAVLPLDEMIAVHWLDLDRFKEANDHFGHTVGDALLQAFAARVRKRLGQDDLLARIGGDEFVIVQCGLRRKDQAQLLAQDVVRRVTEPFEIEGRWIHIGVSIGIALAPVMGVEAQRLLDQADAALYRTKRNGRNGFSFAGQEPVDDTTRTSSLSSAA